MRPSSRTLPVRRAALATVLIVLALAPASARGESLDLTTVMARAAERPAAQAATERARAARAAVAVERRQAILPAVQVSASYDLRSRALTQTTPIGVFELGARDNRTMSVALVQPVFDASRLLYSVPAARHDARAAELAAERTREDMAAAAAGRFFDILTLDAQRAATEALVASLDSRLAELDSLTQVGRALDRDRLRVGLALDDARQDLRTLASRRRVAVAALAQAIGSEEPVEPRFDPAVGPPAIGDDAVAVTRSLSQRSDLRALRAQISATDRRRAGVWSELLPRVEAQGAWLYDDGAVYDQNQFFQASLHLVWTPLASATRTKRAEILAAEQSALTLDLREASQGIRVEVRSALSDYEIASGELAVASKAVGEADEALRVTVERYRAGRETVGDLLEAEAIVRDRRARRDIARIDLWRAYIQLRRATGELLRPS